MCMEEEVGDYAFWELGLLCQYKKLDYSTTIIHSGFGREWRQYGIPSYYLMAKWKPTHALI